MLPVYIFFSKYVIRHVYYTSTKNLHCVSSIRDVKNNNNNKDILTDGQRWSDVRNAKEKKLRRYMVHGWVTFTCQKRWFQKNNMEYTYRMLKERKQNFSPAYILFVILAQRRWTQIIKFLKFCNCMNKPVMYIQLTSIGTFKK